MAKGLSNNLLGRCIVPDPGLGDPGCVNDANGRIWGGLKPNLSGEWLAVIVAAWTEEGTVKLAVHDPHGNTAQLYFTNVKMEVLEVDCVKKGA